MTVNLDAIRRRAEHTRPGPDGVRPVRPGLPHAAYEDREVLLGEVERLIEDLRRERHSHDLTRDRAEAAESELEWLRVPHDAERDRLRAQVEAVRAVCAQVEADNESHLDRFGQHLAGNVVVVAEMIRAALDVQQPATATTSAPDGSEGGGGESGAQRDVCDFEACGRSICWLPGGHDGDCDPGGGCGQAATPCGDRITTWHGRFGPCVQVGQHELHDDGAGAVWSWSETTEEKP